MILTCASDVDEVGSPDAVADRGLRPDQAPDRICDLGRCLEAAEMPHPLERSEAETGKVLAEPVGPLDRQDGITLSPEHYRRLLDGWCLSGSFLPFFEDLFVLRPRQ